MQRLIYQTELIRVLYVHTHVHTLLGL